MMLFLVLFSCIIGLALALAQERRRRRSEYGYGLEAQYSRSTLLRAIHGGVPFFACPVCASVSYNPNDIQFGYCGRCHEATGESHRRDYADSEAMG